MKMLKIRNWESYQQYRDRAPKWIKVHRSLLNDYEIDQLTDAEFGILVKLWLLASQMDNAIPHDAKFIAKKGSIHANSQQLYKVIQRCVQLGFIIAYDDADESVQDCTVPYKNVPREEESREEKRREEEMEEAERFGEGKRVKMTQAEHKKLLDRFGPDQVKALIERLDNYIGSSGRRYKSHYCTILSFAAKDAKEAGERPPRKYRRLA